MATKIRSWSVIWSEALALAPESYEEARRLLEELRGLQSTLPKDVVPGRLIELSVGDGVASYVVTEILRGGRVEVAQFPGSEYASRQVTRYGERRAEMGESRARRLLALGWDGGE